MQETASAARGAEMHRAVRSVVPSLARTLCATAVVVAVGFALFGPIVVHPNSRVLDTFSDAATQMRLYDVMEESGQNPFTFEHDPMNGAPEGYPILTSVQIAAPIQPSFVWAFKDVLGIIGSVNAFLLSGLLLTGVAMFLLLDRCRFGFLPSLFGALLVAFNPWMFERAVSGHIAFAHGWVLIVLLFALLRLREQRTLPRAAAAGAAYGFCFLMASYSGLLATFMVAGFAILDVVSAKTAVERLWTLTLLMMIGAVTAVFLLPGVIALARDGDRVTSSLSRSTEDLTLGGASPLHYVLPSPRHPIFGSFSDRYRPWDVFNEKTLFFGYTTIALVILAVAVLVRERRARIADTVEARRTQLAWLALATIPLAVVSSFGRTLTLAGVDVPMPAYVLGPAISFYRVYARLGFVVAIGAAVLAAFMLARIAERRGGKLAVVALIALVAFELAPNRVDAVAIGTPPAHDRWLATQPRGVVAHYPMMTDQRPAETLAARELYYERFTRQPLFEIYGTARVKTREDAIRLLSRYVTRPETPRILAAEGVRYVVLHDDVYRAQGSPPPEAPPELRFRKRFGPVRIFQLDARPLNLDRLLAKDDEEISLLWGLEPLLVRMSNDGFNAGERYLDYPGVWRWMSQGGTLLIKNHEDMPATVTIEGSAFASGTPRRVEARDEDGTILASTSVPIVLSEFRLGPFDVPAGTSRITLAATPGPTPFGDKRHRFGSIFLSPLRAPQVPDYTKRLSTR